MKKGIDTTRDYLGNYGPLCVYIIGQEQDELKSDKIAKKIVDDYCRNRHGEASNRLSDCLKHKGLSLIERARDGSTESAASVSCAWSTEMIFAMATGEAVSVSLAMSTAA